MPSVEPADDQQQPQEALTSRQEGGTSNSSTTHQNDQSTSTTGHSSTSSDETSAPMEIRDPDRQLIPADRIEHVEETDAPIDLPTVREFTQNDKINKFLLNSFLQRINETDLSQFRRGNGEDDDEEQDFEA